MALEDTFKGGLGKGLAIGLGVAILAPLVFPVIARAAKPMARAALKSGMIMYEKGMEMAAEFGEVVEDLVAESRADLDAIPTEVSEEAAGTAAEGAAAAETAEHTHEA